MPFGMVGIGFRVHDARVGWCPVKQKTSVGPKPMIKDSGTPRRASFSHLLLGQHSNSIESSLIYFVAPKPLNP